MDKHAKYQPLTSHLRAQRADQVRMSFTEIERVIGAKLPHSADSHRAWWSNNPTNNVMTQAWLDAGFESEHVDLPGRKLVFRRVRGAPPPKPRGRRIARRASRPCSAGSAGTVAATWRPDGAG